MPSMSVSDRAGLAGYMMMVHFSALKKDLPYIRHLFLAGIESLGLQPNAKACFSSRLDRELAFLKIRFSCPDGHPRRVSPDHIHPISKAPQVPLPVCSLGRTTPEVIDASIASFKGVLSVSTARHRRALESKALSPLRTFTDIPGQCPKTAQKCPKTALNVRNCIPSTDNTGNI